MKIFNYHLEFKINNVFIKIFKGFKLKALSIAKYIKYNFRKIKYLKRSKIKKKYTVCLDVNLQLFADSAGEKTESATSKKREDARKKGQVLKSTELSSSTFLIALLLSMKTFGGYVAGELLTFFEKTYQNYDIVRADFDMNTVAEFYMEFFIVFLKTTSPAFLAAIFITLVVQIGQVGFLFSLETLTPKLSKISPLGGLKRMFSMNSIVELIKSSIKLLIIGSIGVWYAYKEAAGVLSLMSMEALDAAEYICTTTLDVGIKMCIAVVFLGVMDFIYQWWKFEKDLKMSKQEIKDEHKQIEGNPEIKAKIKQRQRQMSMNRMMQDVPSADVVITNPTHFAVAVKYDMSAGEAPFVVAKGQDFIAQRIKEIAKENNVQIVENKLLARALHKAVEVGGKVPPELYQAVAEILAYIYNLKNNKNTV